MSPDITIVLLTLPGAFAAFMSTLWLWGVLSFQPRLGGILGSGDKIQTTISTSYQDAFNTSNTDIRSLSDVGNVTIGPPGAGGSSFDLGAVAPLIVLVLAGLGGLWLITRRS